MRDYQQMKEIQRLKKQAELEEANGAPEPEESAENEKYAHRGPGFSGWFSHFMEYYKWPAIIILIVAVGVILGISQIAESSDPDLCMMYVGPDYLNAEDQEKVRETAALLSGDIHGDYNGDDRYVADFLDLTISYLEDAEGRIFTYDEQNAARTRFQTEMRAGDTMLYFLDPNFYEIIKAEGLLEPLSDVLGDDFTGFDDYGIHLGDLECHTLPGLERMPSKTILCLRHSPESDAISYQRTVEDWEHHRDLFRSLVAYDSPDVPPEPADEPDAVLFYVGSFGIYGDQRRPMEALLSGFSSDSNGDGVGRVSVSMLLRTGSVARRDVLAKQVRTELRTGQTFLWLLDPEAYLYAKEHDLLEPLPDSLQNAEAAVDGLGLKLNKLPVRETTGFDTADADAVLCLRKNPANEAETYGRSVEKWQNAQEIFRKLAEYEK